MSDFFRAEPTKTTSTGTKQETQPTPSREKCSQSIHDSINAITMAQSTRHSSRCWNRTRAMVKRALKLSKQQQQERKRQRLASQCQDKQMTPIQGRIPTIPLEPCCCCRCHPFQNSCQTHSRSIFQSCLRPLHRGFFLFRNDCETRDSPSQRPSYASPKGKSKIVSCCICDC